MRKLTYLSILEPSVDGYDVFYPDLPVVLVLAKILKKPTKWQKKC